MKLPFKVLFDLVALDATDACVGQCLSQQLRVVHVRPGDYDAQ